MTDRSVGSDREVDAVLASIPDPLVSGQSQKCSMQEASAKPSQNPGSSMGPDFVPSAHKASEGSVPKNSQNVLIPMLIKADKLQYLHQVFPVVGKQPPIIDVSERASNGLYRLHRVSYRDSVSLAPDEHWCLFQSRNDVPVKYQDRVLRWYTYYKNMRAHHVAVCKYL